MCLFDVTTRSKYPVKVVSQPKGTWHMMFFGGFFVYNLFIGHNDRSKGDSYDLYGYFPTLTP